MYIYIYIYNVITCFFIFFYFLLNQTYYDFLIHNEALYNENGDDYILFVKKLYWILYPKVNR